MLAEDLSLQKGQETFHITGQNRSRKKERENRKKNGIRTGPALLRGTCERGEEPTIWKAMVPEGEPLSLRENCSSWTEEGKAERELHKPLVPPPRTPQPETLRWGLGT